MAVSFAVKLRGLLREKGWSQADLCRRCGVNPSSVSNYVNGWSVPWGEARRRIAEAFGVEVAFFDCPEVDEEGRDARDAAVDSGEVVNVPVVVAARLMRRSPNWVMEGLRCGVLPFGYGVKLGKWSFWISSRRFAECTGFDERAVVEAVAEFYGRKGRNEEG